MVVVDTKPEGAPMVVAVDTVPDSARLTAASALQKLLSELVALGLDAKHVHWNASGPSFLSLHELTDEIAASARSWADRVAERAVALGFTVDARPETVAAAHTQLPGGALSDREGVAELVERLNVIAADARVHLDDLDGTDAVGHDIVVEVLEGLDKYRWMLRATIR
jgi:starvation-inducible DNA-binding protein